ncbi:UNVERIFIED_CONTAM: hypothetical protein HDU68_004653, partial [Siphonaria sp. JEL0065]
IAFISGSLDADSAYFQEHYQPAIDAALQQNHKFLVGDSRGIDTLALNYLLQKQAAPRVMVMLLPSNASKLQAKLANAGVSTVVIGGSGSSNKLSMNDLHTLRDSYGTKNSHYDILRYRSQEECKALYGDKYRPRISGTEKNAKRRESGVGLVWIEEEETPIVAVEDARLATKLSPQEKQIKALEKKIHQAKQLAERRRQGDTLERNQLEKIEKLKEWEQELLVLNSNMK